jgi:hypothetical protein
LRGHDCERFREKKNGVILVRSQEGHLLSKIGSREGVFERDLVVNFAKVALLDFATFSTFATPHCISTRRLADFEV